MDRKVAELPAAPEGFGTTGSPMTYVSFITQPETCQTEGLSTLLEVQELTAQLPDTCNDIRAILSAAVNRRLRDERPGFEIHEVAEALRVRLPVILPMNPEDPTPPVQRAQVEALPSLAKEEPR